MPECECKVCQSDLAKIVPCVHEVESECEESE